MPLFQSPESGNPLLIRLWWASQKIKWLYLMNNLIDYRITMEINLLEFL